MQRDTNKNNGKKQEDNRGKTSKKTVTISIPREKLSINKQKRGHTQNQRTKTCIAIHIHSSYIFIQYKKRQK